MDMEKERRSAVIRDCLRSRRGMIIGFLVTSIAYFCIFVLYRLNPEPFLYGMVILLFFGLVTILLDLSKRMKQAERREHLLASPTEEWHALPEPTCLEAEDYQVMIRELGRRAERLGADFDEQRQDMLDYYTAWVHQIKTPIAVMRLQMGMEDSPLNDSLSMELFRIEQYVDMVLQYIRLGSEYNDLVIKEYSLDELVRESVRKFAPQFIQRRLSLRYEPSELRIVTDKKWFGCIMDQLLSNAVKYTPQGGVTIRLSEGDRLQISDTGIGIAPEDLPRIFEKGYTGGNGRLGMKSSGLGLYLCRRAADKLSIRLTAESEPGKGSTFTLNLLQEDHML